MKRAFMCGMLAFSLSMIAIACYIAAGGTKAADTPEPQYVYQVMLDPTAGGPIVLAVEVPEVCCGRTKIVTIDGRVLYTINIPIFVERSKEKLNVDELRKKLAAPILQTQEAVGPVPK